MLMVSKSALLNLNWFCKGTQCAAALRQLEESEGVPVSRQHLRPVSTDCYPISRVICSRRAIVRIIQNALVWFAILARGIFNLKRPPNYFIPTRYTYKYRSQFFALHFILFPFMPNVYKRSHQVSGEIRRGACQNRNRSNSIWPP